MDGKYCREDLQCSDGTCQLRRPCKAECAQHACAYVLDDKCVCGDVCSMDSDAGCGNCFGDAGYGADVTGVCDTCIAGDSHTCADLGKSTPPRACAENKDCCGSWSVPGSGSVPVAVCWKGQCVTQINVTCADLSAPLYAVKKDPRDFGCGIRGLACVPEDVDERPSSVLCQAPVSNGNPVCPEKHIACAY